MSETTKCEGSTTEVCGNADHETCSWCVACVPDSTLREQFDGARICQDCYRRDYEWGMDLSFSLHDEGARGF